MICYFHKPTQKWIKNDKKRFTVHKINFTLNVYELHWVNTGQRSFFGTRFEQTPFVKSFLYQIEDRLYAPGVNKATGQSSFMKATACTHATATTCKQQNHRRAIS